MYFIAGGINDIIVCRGRLETSGDKRQKEKFWTFFKRGWDLVMRSNTEVILEDRWIANLRRLLSSGQSFFPSFSEQPPENENIDNVERREGRPTWLKPCWILKWSVSCCSVWKLIGHLSGQRRVFLGLEVEGEGRWCSTGKYFSTAECTSPVTTWVREVLKQKFGNFPQIAD